MEKKLIRAIIYMSACSIWTFVFSFLAISALRAGNTKAQSVREVVISVNFQNEMLPEVFEKIETKTLFKFLYNKKLAESSPKRVTIKSKIATVEDILHDVSAQTGLGFRQVGNTIVVKFSRLKIRKQAQTGSITGRITDAETGKPMPGTSVYINGTSRGASTDENGVYLIDDVEAGSYTLVATFVGYQKESQKITVKGDEILQVDLTLEIASTEFDDVVVIGYGSSKAGDLTGSVSTINAADLEDLSPVANVDQALQGKAAGVYVVQETGQPGSAARVRVRGSTSLLGSNQPLYVIDGVPVVVESNIPDDGSTFNDELLKEGLNSPLGNINPNDIESISILKDASAAAIYGSRAANGVIIINTKTGSKEGGALFHARYSMSTQEPRTTDMLDAKQFRMIYTEAVENSGSTNSFAQGVLDGSYFGDANTNWEDEVSRHNPVTTNFDLSARGGNEMIQYSVSGGIQNQDGVFEHSSFKRYTANVNLDAQLTDRLDLGSRLNFSSSDQVSPDKGLLDRVYDFRPDISVYDEDGGFTHSGTYSLENPVALSQASNKNKTKQFLGSAFGRFEIIDGLVLQSRISLNYNNGALSSLYPSTTFTGGWSSNNGLGLGFAKRGSNTFNSHIWENTLTYDKFIGDIHKVTALLGASWQGDTHDYFQASGEGFPKDEILTNLSSASGNYTISSHETNSGLASYFGRVKYDYNNRYLLTVAGRMDRSSKFATDNQWAFFPTIAGAWRISNESFFSGIHFIDDLKLRASAGVTGQQDFNPYEWRTLFLANQYGGKPAVIKNQLGNSKLKWETTQQFDLGLDFIALSNRLSGTIGYYEKNTRDLLYFYKTPGNTGFGSVISNLGDTQNRGFEVQLEGDIIRSGTFKWNLSANISHNKNKLVKLNNDFLDPERDVINPPNTGSVLKVGEPIGLLYGYVSEGIIQTQDEVDQLNSGAPDGYYQETGTAPGDLKFKDFNDDGEVTTDDQTIIGNAQPDFTGGFTNTFSYKGLSISALFTFSVGNDLRWGYQSSGINFYSTYFSENKPVAILDRWTTDYPTNRPRAVYLDPNKNYRISSYYVHDASYLRLKNLNITYNLPTSFRPSFFRNASIYATAYNLLTFTKYPGADPETNNLFNDDVSMGLDNNRYPTPKVYTLGLSLGF